MIDIVMPQMGESLAEGTVVRWLKAPGDRVARDEPLFEISTDKVDTDVPSPEAGILREVLADVGQTVAVGAIVARVEADAPAQRQTSGPADAPAVVEAAANVTTAAPEPGGHFKSSHAPQLVSFRQGRQAAPAARTPVAAVAPVTLASAASSAIGFAPISGRTFTPMVLESARQAGLSFQTLTAMQGSGRGGRVTKRDIERYIASPARAQAPTAAASARPASVAPQTDEHVPLEYLYRPTDEDRIVDMSPVRRRIAHHMTWSTRISPHASAFAECDMSRASAVVRGEGERFAGTVGAPLTYTVVAALALVQTLREFPVFNVSVVGESLVLKPRVHLGIAVALADTDDLIVPVVRNADGLSIAGLARAIADVAARARARKLRVEDVQGGTFTLTNPGMFGGLTGTPILNQPQVGIVGLGAIIKRAVVLDGDRIAPRPMMTVSLTFDHRAVDGTAAFRFLARLRQRLEAGPELNT
jgi:pyruvate dehydrogenase E2 component (dihydrolipoamide acetyltransferase)